jgi:hypothetical protein
MKTLTHFCCLILSVLLMVALSACVGDGITNNPTTPVVQSENSTSSQPIASAASTYAAAPTAVPTSVLMELQPVPQGTDTSGSSDPYPLPFIKPADSDTPAAGICGNGTGEIVQIKLGAGPDGLPLGGRCVQVTPLQRLELSNPTPESLHVSFSVFDVEIPSGGIVLLDKPLGEYLARGVHFLPSGPEIWLVDAAPTPIVTAPPPIRVYLNSELGYSVAFTGDWMVDETGMSSCVCREVIFSRPGPQPFVVDLSISIDSHTVEELEKVYAESFPDAQKTNITFSGEPAIQYTLSFGRVEWMLSHHGRTFRLFTDRPDDVQVQAMLASFSFIQ